MPEGSGDLACRDGEGPGTPVRSGPFLEEVPSGGYSILYCLEVRLSDCSHRWFT